MRYAGGMLWARIVRLPFTLLLPVLAVVVWVGIVGLPVAEELVALYRVGSSGHNATVRVGTYQTTIPPERFEAYAVNAAVVTRSHVLTAVYLPGAFVEMPISVATTRPEDWYPREMDRWTWRAVTMVRDSLPSWWLVGLGMEALLRRRRLRWPWLLLSGVLCGMMLVVLGGFAFGASTSAQAGGWWVYAGVVMWIVLFAVGPVAWVRQRT